MSTPRAAWAHQAQWRGTPFGSTSEEGPTVQIIETTVVDAPVGTAYTQWAEFGSGGVGRLGRGRGLARSEEAPEELQGVHRGPGRVDRSLAP